MKNGSENAKAIQVRALELPLEERESFIVEACGADHGLRAEVQALLGATVSYQSTPGGPAADPTAPDSAIERETIGSTIGPYKLLELLGEGGFGSVYAAEQHAPVRRRVALKIIKLGMDTKQVIGRFEAERQALALMDHPFIAKVFDAGATESGRPYFIMELVQGAPITDFCERQKLTTDERLKLFIQVCQALQHAHDRGIVHRDIKPSNVLVCRHEDLATPKVIDFGIAKATHQPLTENTVYTVAHQLIGTPAYMSPEQAEGGGDVDARTDIFSLGVLLYELLTGTTPFGSLRSGTRSHDEIRRSIREDEPPKPSTRLTADEEVQTVARAHRTTPGTLKRRLRGDLDWVVMKCLEKDRTDRYKTAQQLAEDVQRYLNEQPVHASPPSVTYQVRKYIRRRRRPLLVAALVLLVAVGGVVSSLLFLTDANRRARQVQRLDDIKVMAHLQATHGELLATPFAQRRLALEEWLSDAETLLARLPAHRADLAALRDSGNRTAAPADSSARWSFSDSTDQRQHDDLDRLVQWLDALEQPAGQLNQVRAWRDVVPAIDAWTNQWQQAGPAIAGQYPGFELAPQSRLFPLGADPQSKLWEFVDLGTGQMPRRDPAGGWRMEAETGVVYVLVPGGEFLMGSPLDEPDRADDEHQHRAQVSTFLISKFEITSAQWERVMSRHPGLFEGPTHPADSLSWYDCQEFCRRSQSALPTEAQWQFACRGGKTSPFSGTGRLDDMGWYKQNSQGKTHGVGQKQPNQFGIYDMHGNVLEWAQDLYSTDFFHSPAAGEQDPVHDDSAAPRNAQRVLLGGSFEGKADYCRSGDRYHEKADLRWRGFGLRPVWVIGK